MSENRENFYALNVRLRSRLRWPPQSNEGRCSQMRRKLFIILAPRQFIQKRDLDGPNFSLLTIPSLNRSY